MPNGCIAGRRRKVSALTDPASPGRAGLVSVVMPAFNASRTVAESIDSVLSQTYPDVELIVVDDGSTDDTPAVLAGYGNRIQVLRQDNAGTAAACNAGVSASKGEWVAFLDSDDIWLPSKLERQLAHCGRWDVSHTDSICFGEQMLNEIRRSSFEPPASGSVIKSILVRNSITKSSVLMRKRLFEECGGFPSRHGAVEDWPLWISACARAELGYLPEPLVRYRVHPQSKSMAYVKTLAAHRAIIDEAFGSRGPGRDFPELRNEARYSSYEIHAHYAALCGDWRLALSCCLLALGIRPGSALLWKRTLKVLLIPFGHAY